MPENIRIGIIRETKIPPDKRTAITPIYAGEVIKRFPYIKLFVQPGQLRCFRDSEYARYGTEIKEDLSACDILVGVKEVDISALIPGKTYLFFAHVGKEQPYNRDLLLAILDKRIRLIDYEYITDKEGQRLIAFGRWAGIVGAYNGLRGWGLRTGDYKLKPAHQCRDYEEMKGQLSNIKLNNSRILITGGGRVAWGAVETLSKSGIREVSHDDYLEKDFNEPVFCRIDPWHYAERIDGRDFMIQHFFDNPSLYKSKFKPYTRKTDIYIAAHFWDPESPRMFELNEMDEKDFRISMIADISCDINGSVPSTMRASTIDEPFYGFDPQTKRECKPFKPLPSLTMMTVDNLPGELPRDASEDFAEILVRDIIPKLIGPDPDGVIERATITENGKLKESFAYLKNYAEGK